MKLWAVWDKTEKNYGTRVCLEYGQARSKAVLRNAYFPCKKHKPRYVVHRVKIVKDSPADSA